MSRIMEAARAVVDSALLVEVTPDSEVWSVHSSALASLRDALALGAIEWTQAPITVQADVRSAAWNYLALLDRHLTEFHQDKCPERGNFPLWYEHKAQSAKRVESALDRLRAALGALDERPLTGSPQYVALDNSRLLDQAHHRACINWSHPPTDPCIGYDGAWSARVLERGQS